MTTMESFSKALELFVLKKENLRRAFETLQAHSPSIPLFNLTWSDLDSHFASQIASLQSNLYLLQCLQNPQLQRPASPAPVPARPELKSLCQKMKALGLKNYITERPGERAAIKSELQDALRCAPDPAGLVLVAVEGFHDENSGCDRRWSCVVLLEELAALKAAIKGEVKAKAKKLAEEWRMKSSGNVENSVACLGFLYLVAAYGLAAGFDMADLIDLVVIVAKDSEFVKAVKLCRLLGLNVSDLISKLKMMSERLLAVKFILEFELADKFPPVPILKEQVELLKKLSERPKKRKKGTVSLPSNAATKEINTLELVIKIIEEYKLSENPKEALLKHIESVEKVEMQHSAESPTSKPQQQASTHDPSESKHLESQEPVSTASQPQQQSKTQEQPSGSKCLENDQPVDTTVDSKRVTDESKQHASVSTPKPQQQSNPQEPSGSKRLKTEPGVTTVASKSVTDESQKSKPQELSGRKPPSAEQVGQKVILNGAVHSTPNYSAFPQSHLQPAAQAGSNFPAFSQSHLQPAGPWAAHPGSFAGSAGGPYGWGGPNPSVASNVGPSGSFYGPSVGPFGVLGNLRPPGPHVYPREPHPPVASNVGPSGSFYGPSVGPFGVPGNLRPPGPHVFPHEPHPPVGYFPFPPHNGYGLPPQFQQR